MEKTSLPDPNDVRQLTALLDLMEKFASNEQRARYILSSNWLRDRGAAAAQRIAGSMTTPLAQASERIEGWKRYADERAGTHPWEGPGIEPAAAYLQGLRDAYESVVDLLREVDTRSGYRS